jgi:hypothetical protein
VVARVEPEGWVVAEAPRADHAIAKMPAGRMLRGHVSRPVSMHGFAQLQQVFGELWQPSPMTYAVEQFFESGGRQAAIVRICNGGRPATIAPCARASVTSVNDFLIAFSCKACDACPACLETAVGRAARSLDR